MCAWCKLSVDVVSHARIAVRRRLQTTHGSNISGQAERDLGDCQSVCVEALCKSSLMQDRDVLTADYVLMAFIIMCIGIITVRRSTSSICLQRQNASAALGGCNLSGQLHQPLHAYKNC